MVVIRIFCLILSLFLARLCFGDAGVLVPISIQDTPNPAILSLDNMQVEIEIDNQLAKVKVLQIFENHTDQTIEGKYLFVIPEKAAISDFAIWDAGVRIPGVILEKRRAREIYEEITRQQIDPGLLEQVSEEQINLFSAEVFPIPAYGTKRLEVSYAEELGVTSCKSFLSFPLKPTRYQDQRADTFELKLHLKNQFPIKDFFVHSKQIKPKITRQTPYELIARFSGRDLVFDEDFAFEYSLDIKDTFFNFLTYRKTDISDEPVPIFTKAVQDKDIDGYFHLQAIFNLQNPSSQASSPKTIFLLLDTSLSMRWDKLDKAYEAIEYFLRNLSGNDQFQLILFNDCIKTLPLLTATPQNIERALGFIQASYLLSGTDLKKALTEAITLANKTTGPRYIVMITDGQVTLGELSYKRLNAHLAEINKATIPLFIFGIGNDTNIPLLEELTKPNDGYFVWAGETEDLTFKLKTFLANIGQGLIRGIRFIFASTKNIKSVYPVDLFKTFNGSLVSVVGRYIKPGEEGLKIEWDYKEKKYLQNKRVILPATSTTHPHIKRLWAKARVEYLLQQIRYEGEKEDWIDEVIALSKQYNFVTPYTSFLAAPRSLLRPRIIKPGDPILRVRCDESIVDVIALFPFGLTKALHYIKEKDFWQCRFLAPVWMKDGTYKANLLLTDRDGNQYEEEKQFIIDSKPPTLKVSLSSKSVQAGGELSFKVDADRDTRTISAKLYNLAPVNIEYDAQAKASLGKVILPKGMPSGVYKIKVVAEDFAHNISVIEVQVEVI